MVLGILWGGGYGVGVVWVSWGRYFEFLVVSWERIMKKFF